MVHEEKKITKIVEELTLYFFAIGGTEMNSQIKRDGNDVTITFSSNYKSEYKREIKKLEEYLNEPKNIGIEDIYWELAGSGDPGESSQLLLIGMMIDSHEVNKTKEHIEIIMHRKMVG